MRRAALSAAVFAAGWMVGGACFISVVLLWLRMLIRDASRHI